MSDLSRKMYLAEKAAVREHLAEQEQPPADQTALRDRIAAALYERERPPRDPHWPEVFASDREVFEAMADAVLAVLPEPADRAELDSLGREADRLRKDWVEMRDRAERIETEVQRLRADRSAVLREAAQRLYTALFPAVYADMGQKAAEGVNRAVSELRRMADETQPACPGYETVPNRCGCDCEGCQHHCGAHQPESMADETATTQTQAHPPLHQWRVEILDGDEWMPASGLRRDRSQAAEQMRMSSERRPLWNDGTGVQRRLVRETTTYTVEDETGPAAGARSESCVHCGQPISRVTGTLAAWWVHDPGGNTVCDPARAAASTRATPAAAVATERCAHCTHPKGDHDGRADHRAKHSPLVAGEPWCHACNAQCDYAAGARQDGGRP